MNYMDKVSKRIVELREERGETQQELADAIGITRQSLSRYEIAARTINVDVLGALARHFCVSADYLLGLSDVKSTEHDMQIACNVTGLSEKAIDMLSDRGILAYCCRDNNNPARVYEEILNRVLSNALFYDMVSNYAQLFEVSEEMYQSRSLYHFCFPEMPNFTKKEAEIIFDATHRFNEKGLKAKDRECDVCRYLCINLTEQLADIFDARKKVKEFTKDQLVEYLDIANNQIEQEDTTHAQHHQTQE